MIKQVSALAVCGLLAVGCTNGNVESRTRSSDVSKDGKTATQTREQVRTTSDGQKVRETQTQTRTNISGGAAPTTQPR